MDLSIPPAGTAVCMGTAEGCGLPRPFAARNDNDWKLVRRWKLFLVQTPKRCHCEAFRPWQSVSPCWHPHCGLRHLFCWRKTGSSRRPTPTKWNALLRRGRRPRQPAAGAIDHHRRGGYHPPACWHCRLYGQCHGTAHCTNSKTPLYFYSGVRKNKLTSFPSLQPYGRQQQLPWPWRRPSRQCCCWKQPT